MLVESQTETNMRNHLVCVQMRQARFNTRMYPGARKGVITLSVSKYFQHASTNMRNHLVCVQEGRNHLVCVAKPFLQLDISTQMVVGTNTNSKLEHSQKAHTEIEQDEDTLKTKNNLHSDDPELLLARPARPRPPDRPCP